MNKKKIINLILLIAILIFKQVSGINYDLYQEWSLWISCLPLVFIISYIYHLIKKEKFYESKSFDNCLLYTNITFIIICIFQYLYNVLYANKLLKLLDMDHNKYSGGFLLIAIFVFAFVYFLLFIWLLALKKKKIKNK